MAQDFDRADFMIVMEMDHRSFLACKIGDWGWDWMMVVEMAFASTCNCGTQNAQ